MPPKIAEQDLIRDTRAALPIHTSDESPDAVTKSGKNATSATLPDQQDHQIPPNQGGNEPDFGVLQGLIVQEGANAQHVYRNS